MVPESKLPPEQRSQNATVGATNYENGEAVADGHINHRPNPHVAITVEGKPLASNGQTSNEYRAGLAETFGTGSKKGCCNIS
jgi:hypothetical protein